MNKATHDLERVREELARCRKDLAHKESLRTEQQLHDLKRDLEVTVADWKGMEKERDAKDRIITFIQSDLLKEREKTAALKMSNTALEDKLRTINQELQVYKSIDVYHSSMKTKLESFRLEKHGREAFTPTGSTAKSYHSLVRKEAEEEEEEEEEEERRGARDKVRVGQGAPWSSLRGDGRYAERRPLIDEESSIYFATPATIRHERQSSLMDRSSPMFVSTGNLANEGVESSGDSARGGSRVAIFADNKVHNMDINGQVRFFTEKKKDDRGEEVLDSPIEAVSPPSDSDHQSRSSSLKPIQFGRAASSSPLRSPTGQSPSEGWGRAHRMAAREEAIRRSLALERQRAKRAVAQSDAGYGNDVKDLPAASTTRTKPKPTEEKMYKNGNGRKEDVKTFGQREGRNNEAKSLISSSHSVGSIATTTPSSDSSSSRGDYFQKNSNRSVSSVYRPTKSDFERARRILSR